MSCIIFGYRRFYAIICKITHFFYPKRKNPPLFAHSTLLKAKSVPCTTLPARAASASPPAAETMTGDEHFSHPGYKLGNMRDSIADVQILNERAVTKTTQNQPFICPVQKNTLSLYCKNGRIVRLFL